VLCLSAADPSVMFISIEGMQILALGWLRNDSVATGTKSSCRGSLPHLNVSLVLTHTPPGLWRDTLRNGWDARVEMEWVRAGGGTALPTPCPT